MSAETPKEENQTPPPVQVGWVSCISPLFFLMLLLGNKWEFALFILTEEKNRDPLP